jgi:hypothetical protein
VNKEQVLRRLKDAGFQLDLRQEGRALVFATFSGTDVGSEHRKLRGILAELKTFYIKKTCRTQFSSTLKAITLCPIISSFGAREYGCKLSHRPSEMHVFISVQINPDVWRSFTPKAAKIYLVEQLLLAIDQIRGSWLNTSDREKLKQIFASFVAPKKAKANSAVIKK